MKTPQCCPLLSKPFHKVAVKWLMDRANPEEEGGLGVFADTRFCGALTKLLEKTDRAATKRALARGTKR